MTPTVSAGIRAAVVDYGLGNLFSIKRACEHAGIEVLITPQKDDILAADVVILPGVGAFGDAMAALRRLDLVNVLREVAESGKPLVGICLGIQLLMNESYEFGVHQGLGIIEGPVVRFENPRQEGRVLKVPQVQWNRIFCANGQLPKEKAWSNTPLEGVEDGEFMYFVHSYFVRPTDPSVVLSVSRYGSIEFCSSLRHRNIFACQFHPERSGAVGLQVYRNLFKTICRVKGKDAA